MALLYYYTEVTNKRLLEDGIDIVESYDEKIIINSQIVPCIKCFLLPQDDKLKFQRNENVCIEIEVQIDDCFVVDDDLIFLPNKEKYYKSIVKLSDYKFGLYRNPRVAVIKSVKSSQIKQMDKIIGTPLIYGNSNDLYKSNVFEEFRNIYSDFDDTMLGVFFMLMSQKGMFELLKKILLNDNNTLYLYRDKKTDKIYTITIREGTKNG